jgi:hypothetical protein
LKTTGADAEHRKYWWRFANVRLELRARAATMRRFLATARVSKRPVFAFMDSSWTPSEQVVVFPLPTGTAFAVLQSRVHYVWLTFQASHMGEAMRYSATDCFASFPFPTRDPAGCLEPLEGLGERLHEARAQTARTRETGLTQTYNAMLDPDCDEPDIVVLRAQHEALDRAVLDAYGWQDVAVPPYVVSERTTPEAYGAFEDAVAERLYRLNAERAASEPTPHGGPSKSARRPRNAPEPRASRKR